ncbi:MAG TPA: hypothetical protein DCG12_01860, partial [Planctomycetaceae bacterium]|nr:hypothetical protein [Planctomycetaceae bacterium]
MSPAIRIPAFLLMLLFSVSRADLAQTQELIRSRCLDCHGSNEPAAGMNLTDLVNSTNPHTVRDHWLKAEKMIA